MNITDGGVMVVEVAAQSGAIHFITSLMSNPTAQMIATAVGGWVLKIIFDIIVSSIRAKGKSDVQKAEQALDSALKTNDAQDDAVAKMALDRAKTSQEFLDRIADELERHKPGLLASPKIPAVVAPASEAVTPKVTETPK